MTALDQETDEECNEGTEVDVDLSTAVQVTTIDFKLGSTLHDSLFG